MLHQTGPASTELSGLSSMLHTDLLLQLHFHDFRKSGKNWSVIMSSSALKQPFM